MTVETASETRKRLRGTRRVCRTCEESFYDLGRDPTVCPMCSASVPVSEFDAPAHAAAKGYQSQGGWGKRQKPALPVVKDEEPASEALTDDVEADDADVDAAATDDTLLEDDVDDDVDDLLGPGDEKNGDE